MDNYEEELIQILGLDLSFLEWLIYDNRIRRVEVELHILGLRLEQKMTWEVRRQLKEERHKLVLQLIQLRHLISLFRNAGWWHKDTQRSVNFK